MKLKAVIESRTPNAFGEYALRFPEIGIVKYFRTLEAASIHGKAAIEFAIAPYAARNLAKMPIVTISHQSDREIEYCIQDTIEWMEFFMDHNDLQ